MICVTTQYFNLNRIILLLVGLWPYQQSKLVYMQTIFNFGFLISCIVYQFSVFISADYTPDLLVKVLSIASFFFIYVIEYSSFRINNQIFKWSLEQLQHIHNELKDEREIDIMKKYGNNAKRATAIFILVNISMILIIVLLPFVIYALNDILFINEHDMKSAMQTMIPKHFVGREHYFHLIYIYMSIALSIGGTVIVAIGMLFIACIVHACGMFKIVRYRIEQAITVNGLNNNLKDEIPMYKKIIHAVDIHRKAIKLISEIILLGGDFQQFIIHFLLVIIIFLYFFLENYVGQELINHNDRIFSTAYNVRWYIAPLHVQKLILFLLQRGTKAVSLNLGGIFVFSLEFFGTLTKASISYFTFSAFVSADCTPNLVVKVFSIASFFLMFVIEYSSFRMNNQIMKWSLEQLQHIYNELKDEKEIDIIKRYGNSAKRFTAIVILFHINNLILVCLMPFALYAFNGILNKQDIKRVIQTIIPKHFVGREHYFYLIYLHVSIAFIAGGTAIVATGVMIIAYVIHACGIFRIARFTALFFSGCDQSRLALITFAVICLSLNLYGISETILFGDDFQQFIIHFLLVLGIFVYCFAANYAGQELINHNDHIFSIAQTEYVFCKVMICVTTQYFNLNRIILLLVGLWPYQRSKLVYMQIIFILGLLISYIVYQFSAFVFADYTPDLVVKVFSITSFVLMFVIEYSSFRMNNQIMKWSLEQLQHIYNELKDEKEIDIVKRYGNSAKRLTAIVILFNIINQLSIISMPMLPRILGIFLFINGTDMRAVVENIMPKYFFYQDNYFYLIMLHVEAAICIGGTTMVATGMMLIAYLKHACGMFKIASYRIEKAITINMQENISFEDEIIIYREMIYAVDIHRKAIKFSTFLLSSFQGSHFCLIIVGVVCLSLNLYGISVTAPLGHDIDQCLVHLVIVLIIFLYLFLANYAGQEVTDHNENVYSTAYNVRWYVTPLHIQRLILFLLQRGSKAVSLNLGGVFVMSLELFASLTKASVSYFTVVCSTQQ
ncbi:hypothetical protein P5V15_013364 [Pogonomyrmex californicus]